MNVLVIDTSSWISYFKSRPSKEIDRALAEGRVYLPAIVAAELLSGKLSPKHRAQMVDFLKELPLCDCSLEHWIRAGQTRAALMAHGLAVSTPDAHIVQSCLDLDGYLVSEDKIFAKIARYLDLRLA